MKKRSHKFVVKVSFGRGLTRREALQAMRDSGQMGKGANDFYDVPRGEDYVDGEMKVTGIVLAKAGT